MKYNTSPGNFNKKKWISTKIGIATIIFYNVSQNKPNENSASSTDDFSHVIIKMKTTVKYIIEFSTRRKKLYSNDLEINYTVYNLCINILHFK